MLRLERERSIWAKGLSTIRRTLSGKTHYEAGNRRSRFVSIKVRRSRRREQVYNATADFSPPKFVQWDQSCRVRRL